MEVFLTLLVVALGLGVLLDITVGRYIRSRALDNVRLHGLRFLAGASFYSIVRSAVSATAIGALIALAIAAVFGGLTQGLFGRPTLEDLRWLTQTIFEAKVHAAEINVMWASVAVAVLCIAHYLVAFRVARSRLQRATAEALREELNDPECEPDADGNGRMDLYRLDTTEPRFRREFLEMRAQSFESTLEQLVKQIKKSAGAKNLTVPTNGAFRDDLKRQFVEFVQSPSIEAVAATGVLVDFDSEGVQSDRTDIISEMTRMKSTGEALRAACRELDKADGGYCIAPPETVFAHRVDGKLPKLWRLLASRGAFELAHAGSRVYSSITVALLIPSLIAVQSPTFMSGVTAIYADLSDFTVAISKEEAAVALQQHPGVTNSTPQDDDDASDAATYRNLARAYEAALIRSVAAAMPRSKSTRTHPLPSRAQVARSSVVDASSSRVIDNAHVAPVERVSHSSDDAARALLDSYAGRHPVTQPGQDFEALMRTEHQAGNIDDELWRDIKRRTREWATSFDEPLSAAKFRNTMAVRALGIGGNQSSIAGLSPEGARRVADSTRADFIKAVANGQPIDSAIKAASAEAHFASLADIHPPEMDSLDRRVSSRVSTQIEQVHGQHVEGDGPSLSRSTPPEAPPPYDWPTETPPARSAAASVADDAARWGARAASGAATGADALLNAMIFAHAMSSMKSVSGPAGGLGSAGAHARSSGGPSAVVGRAVRSYSRRGSHTSGGK